MKTIDYINILSPELRSRKDDKNIADIARQCSEYIKKHNIQIVIPKSPITGEHFL